MKNLLKRLLTISIEITPQSRQPYYTIPLWVRLYRLMHQSSKIEISLCFHPDLFQKNGAIQRIDERQFSLPWILESATHPWTEHEKALLQQTPIVAIPSDLHLPGHFYPYRIEDFKRQLEQLIALSQVEKNIHRVFQTFLQQMGRPIESTEVPALQKQLIADLRKKEDTFISRTLNRPISLWITKHLANTPISPNILSVVVLVVGLIGALLVAFSGYIGVLPVYGWLVLGGLLFHVSSILDGCDGEIARLKHQTTEFGATFDDLGDEITNAMMIIALGYRISLDWLLILSVVAGGLLLTGRWLAFESRDAAKPTPPMNPHTGATIVQPILRILQAVARNDMYALFIFVTMVLGMYTIAYWVSILFAVGVFAYHGTHWLQGRKKNDR